MSAPLENTLLAHNANPHPIAPSDGDQSSLPGVNMPVLAPKGKGHGLAVQIGDREWTTDPILRITHDCQLQAVIGWGMLTLISLNWVIACINPASVPAQNILFVLRFVIAVAELWGGFWLMVLSWANFQRVARLTAREKEIA